LIRIVGNQLVIGTSFSTAISVFLISIGLFIARPDWVAMSIVAGKRPGNLLVQRLAPVAILLPIGFGIVASRLLGTEESPFVLAFLTDGSATVSLSLLGITAVRVNRGHDTLEEERSRTRELIDLASDAIFIARLDGGIIEVNEAAYHLLGYSREELLTKNISDLIPPDDQERLRRHRAALLGGHAVTEEWMAVRKDGTRLPVEVSSKVLPSLRWQAIVRDISERKRLEEVLHQSDTEHRLLAQLATVLAETVDFDQRLTKIGQLFSRELSDISIVEAVADDGSRRRALAACRDPMNQWRCDLLMRPAPNREGAREISPKVAAGELRLIQKLTPDVTDFLAPNADQRVALQNAQSVIVAPLHARGRLLGAVSLLSFSRAFGEHDLQMVRGASRIAALMLDNARLLAATDQARQARDDTLGVVAHDLRNPLTVIAALGTTLKRGPEHEIGEMIEKSANRMSRLIQDLLDVTRLEVGPLTLEQTVLTSNEFLSDVLASQGPLVASASLEIRLDAAPDLPDIWADRDRLLQVFENLIGNAVKFSKPGGHISVAARAGPSEVLFSVADTGSGIESKDLPHLFDRFWQGPEANRGGVGLGLPIVKGIVEAHGGRVWVQSSPGQGTTFFFTIPTAARANVQPPADSTAHDRMASLSHG
jgi:PAS domain S-box-containing protein